MNGAQMVVKALELEGVRCVFGIPGGSVIPLYDALYERGASGALNPQSATAGPNPQLRLSGLGYCARESGVEGRVLRNGKS